MTRIKIPFTNTVLVLGAGSGKKDEQLNNPVNYIVERAKSRGRKDIGDWRKALVAAENVERPKRSQLYQIYNEITLDAKVSAQMELRVNRLLSRRFSLYNANNEAQLEATYLLKKPWFNKMVKMLWESIMYGHSLVAITKVEPLNKEGGGVIDVELVPREHVVPEFGYLLKDKSDDKGIEYRYFPDFEGYIIETPDSKSLGLLSKIAPYALYKRFALACNSQYSELFGMPLRVGKTSMRDTAMVSQMGQMLANMGAAAYAVIDKDEELELIQPQQGNGDVFQKIIDKCNHEMAELITGAVIGDARSTGSLAKEEVGERLADYIHQADVDFIESLINAKLFPILIQHGYPLKGLTFAYEEQKDLEQLFDMTSKTLQFYDVDEAWLKETFGIAITGKKINPSSPENLSPFFD
jgi:phage gp29-like protein